MTLFAAIAPATLRNVLLILVGGSYLGYHLFHLWRRWRAEGNKVKASGEGEGEQRNLPTDSEGTVGRGVPSAPKSEDNTAALSPDGGGQRVARPIVSASPKPIKQSNSQTVKQVSALSGEELYAQARAIPHQEIPNSEWDGEYLELLVKSAVNGFARASMKLGDYAMRRGTWVEAYYWMSQAKRQGMPDLDGVMREIRRNWAFEDFPDEGGNIKKLFDEEAGSIGRALLGIDSGHDAASARAFLAANHPEFL